MSSPDECNMLDLNDDCFYHIYTFLPIFDWCSLRETCTRFRTISDYCFERRSETFQLRHINDSSYSLSVSEVQRVLRHFGKFIKTLSINQKHFGHEDCGELMPFLDRYCQSLLDLKFVNLKLTSTTIVKCSRLFENLQRLVFDQCDDEEVFSACLTKCGPLKELELIRLFNIAGDILANNCIESLESFQMSGCLDFNYDALKSFLAKNCQLTQVKLFRLNFRDGQDSPFILEDVANLLPKLEALSLFFNIGFLPNLIPVTKMASLKKLEVNLTYTPDNVVNIVLTGLATHNKIEHLHFVLFKCADVSIRLLSKLKSLKILKFTETNKLSVDICKRLASELCMLEEIHIVECIDVTLNEVKEFVVHAPNLRKIIFNRADESQTSLTHEMFFSLVEARKSLAPKKGLLLFLNDDDLREVQQELKWNGMAESLVKHVNVLEILPLDKEHRRTVFEYGSSFMQPMRQKLSSSYDIDEDIYDSYSDDDDDWHFGY